MLVNPCLLATSAALLLLLASPLSGQTVPPTSFSAQPSPAPSGEALTTDTVADKQPGARIRPSRLRLKLNFPLLDLPYGLYASNVRAGAVANVGETPSGYRPFQALSSPSMEQSTQFSLDTRYALFYGTQRLLRRKPTDQRFRKIWKIGAEVVLNTGLDLTLPFGQGWQHEEFHRATMTHCTIYCNNTLNDWLTGRTNVNSGNVAGVNMVRDEDLVALKAKSNPDFVRLQAAGIEGEIYSGEQMQQNQFFYNTGSLHSLSILSRFISPQLYLALCANKSKVNDLVATALKDEGSNQSLRDFTGPDLTGWAYDLYNPNVPYAARGLNPNGNGYDRYIYDDKLNAAQYDWIKKQSNLALLNLVSPLNFFVNSITLKQYANGEKLEGNFGLRYYPTSFGNQLGLNLLVRKGRYQFVFNPALNQNLNHSFPSLEAMLVDYPVTSHLLVTTRLMAWSQPKNQEFLTSDAQAGGLASATVSYRTGLFFPYSSLTYKTKGWVAGNVFLGDKFDVKVGLGVRF